MLNKKFFKYKNKKIYYYFKQGNEINLFLHGVGGCSEHFFEAFRYSKKNKGILTIDLPGFGQSSKWSPSRLKITQIHIKSILFILKKLEITKFNLVLFSLATCYLQGLINSNKWPDINKVIFIEPSITMNDLDWSKKIYYLTATEYTNYMNRFKKDYPRLINIIFPKINKIQQAVFTKSIKSMDSSYLKKIIYESVNQIKNKTILRIFNQIEKKTISFYSENNSLNNKKKFLEKKKSFKIKSKNHYIMLDKPKLIYSRID